MTPKPFQFGVRVEHPQELVNAVQFGPRHERYEELLGNADYSLVAHGRTVFVRPLAEMNGHWNSYSAFNANGSARDANHSTSAFRRAFARIYLIVHGAKGINGRLRALGMPPFKRDATPAPNAAIVWKASSSFDCSSFCES